METEGRQKNQNGCSWDLFLCNTCAKTLWFTVLFSWNITNTQVLICFASICSDQAYKGLEGILYQRKQNTTNNIVNTQQQEPTKTQTTKHVWDTMKARPKTNKGINQSKSYSNLILSQALLLFYVCVFSLCLFGIWLSFGLVFVVFHLNRSDFKIQSQTALADIEKKWIHMTKQLLILDKEESNWECLSLVLHIDSGQTKS